VLPKYITINKSLSFHIDIKFRGCIEEKQAYSRAVSV